MNQLQWLVLIVYVRGFSFAVLTNKENYYGFIFDVGSTGTRLNVFAIEYDETPELSSEHISEHRVNFLERIRCDIAFNAETDINVAKTKIDNCLDVALNKYKLNPKKRNIWIRFAGTGGLRTLRDSNKQKFNEIMDAMDKFFRLKEYTMPSNVEFVEVIDGNTEAELGYISSIYIPGTKTVEEKGVLDMGGSSFQVVFPIPQNSIALPFSTKGEISLFNKNHHYASLNFKCGGGNNIKYYYLIKLFKSSNTAHSTRIQSPCHPKNFQHDFETTKFKNFCTSALIGDTVLPNKIIIVGSGDVGACQKILLDAFCSHDDTQYNKKCILDDVSKVPISVPNQIKINLLGSWTYFSRDLKTTDYKSLLQKMEKMFISNDCFIDGYERCFGARYLIYITNFFIKPNDQVEINPISSGWTLGKMLVDSRNIVLSGTERHTTMVIIIVVVAMIVLLCIGVAYFCSRRRKFGFQRDRSVP